MSAQDEFLTRVQELVQVYTEGQEKSKTAIKALANVNEDLAEKNLQLRAKNQHLQSEIDKLNSENMLYVRELLKVQNKFEFDFDFNDNFKNDNELKALTFEQRRFLLNRTFKPNHLHNEKGHSDDTHRTKSTANNSSHNENISDEKPLEEKSISPFHSFDRVTSQLYSGEKNLYNNSTLTKKNNYNTEVITTDKNNFNTTIHKKTIDYNTTTPETNNYSTATPEINNCTTMIDKNSYNTHTSTPEMNNYIYTTITGDIRLPSNSIGLSSLVSKSPSKPPYSFPTLILMAIEDTKEKKILLKDIYGFIQKTFPYYQTAPEGWKNSIRHNLSLNKYFKKVGRHPGIGCFWAVNEKRDLDLDRLRKKITTSLKPPQQRELRIINSIAEGLIKERNDSSEECTSQNQQQPQYEESFDGQDTNETKVFYTMSQG